MDTSWIIVALIFATVFLAVEFTFGLIRGSRQRQQINRRLSLTGEHKGRQAVLEQLRRERGLFDGDYSKLGFMQRVVVQSGLRLTTGRLLGFFFMASFASFMVIGFLISFNVFTVLLAGLISALLMMAYVMIVRSRRVAAFGIQLPEAIDVMVRSLRAGHPVPVSLALVAEEMQDPAGTEFGIAADEITYGSDLETAMDNLYHRVGQEDLLLMVISVSIQASTGGNLSEILSKLSRVIRDRFKMRRKVRAISSEGRLSGVFLSLLPIILFGVLNLLSPSYYGDVWSHPFIIPGFILGGVMMVIGNIIIYRMVNFRY